MGFGNRFDMAKEKLCDNENWKIKTIQNWHTKIKKSKYPLQTSVKIYKLILKHMWKCEGYRIAKKLLKKNNFGGLFKFCYKASKIMIMYYYHIKNTHKIILCLRPSVKVKTTKFSEANIEYLCNLRVGKDFLHRILKRMTIKIFLIN